MKRIYTIITLLIVTAAAVMAQNPTMKGEVEEVVHVGDNFKLRYTLNSTDVRNFQLGQIPDALRVLFGPSQSSSVSSVTINGQHTTTSTMTLTYVLSATEKGSFTIPPASATVEGQTVRSKALTVQVIDAASGSSGSSGSAGAAPSAGRQISSDNMFVIVTATKRHVVEQEPLLITYKICWHPDVPVVNFDDISLELQDVYMQPFNDTQQKSQKIEQIRGRTMATVDWKQYVVYPQKAGTLVIPSQQFTGYVRQDMYIDPYDPFASTYREASVPLTTPELTITVDALPERPADYSGGVGRLSLSGQPDKTTLKANTPLTVTVTVSGRGNLNMIKAPVLDFPSSFDTYDTKQTENYHVTADGISGSITYEMMAVPQREGTFMLPPARLVYYDLDAHGYRTLTTDSFQITVTPGQPGSQTVTDFSDGVQPGDIHPVKTGPGHPLSRSGRSFFASAVYWAVIALLIVLTLLVLLFMRQRAIGRADVGKARAGQANRVATRRLRKAARLMKAGQPQPFYDETLRALWGYVGDRLNMPVSTLTRDNISQRLAERGVTEQPVSLFLQALDECEYMRYAPGDPQGNMNHVYDQSVTAIEQIEQQMKAHKQKKSASRSAVVLALMLAGVGQTLAVPTKMQADEYYSQEVYDSAVAAYEELLRQAPDADVYYNLGNAYYRQGDMAHAILNYERALQLRPGDADARYNLQIASSKTVDKVAPEREMFFVTWYHSLSSLLSVDAWAYTALVALAVALVLLLVYRAAASIAWRKVAFFGMLAFVLCFLLANLFAWQQQYALTHRRQAVVMVPEVSVSNTPAEGASKEFSLHAGTKVTVTDDHLAGWRQVLLSDGRQGWMPETALEVI